MIDITIDELVTVLGISDEKEISALAQKIQVAIKKKEEKEELDKKLNDALDIICLDEGILENTSEGNVWDDSARGSHYSVVFSVAKEMTFDAFDEVFDRIVGKLEKLLGKAIEMEATRLLTGVKNRCVTFSNGDYRLCGYFEDEVDDDGNSRYFEFSSWVN